MHKPQPLHIHFYDLMLMELSNWRWSWRASLVSGTIAPILSIMALGAFSRAGNEHNLPYILTGNVIFSFMFQIMP